MAEIVFLGTAAALRLPSFHCTCSTCESARSGAIPERTRASIGILGDQTTIIDSGPDIAEQLEREGIRRIDNVLLTHWHYDHIGGLTEFGEPGSCEGWDLIPVFTPQSGIDHFNSELQYLKRRFAPHLVEPNKPFEIGSTRIVPVKSQHTEDSLGFILTGNRTVAYMGDGIRPPDETMDRLKGIDVLIIEASLDELDEADWLCQDIASAVEIWKEVACPECILTHMSFHRWRGGNLIAGFTEEERHAVLEQHPGLRMAEDGLRIPF
ncbi:MAG: MBL fold metallo-hydrolase [Gemmatimonadota bacterium]|jgi:phosphoribosyl 1,2-cyclic phosphate phosphodiesterase